MIFGSALGRSRFSFSSRGVLFRGLLLYSPAAALIAFLRTLLVAQIGGRKQTGIRFM